MKRRVSLPVLSSSNQRLQRKATSEGWRLCLRPNRDGNQGLVKGLGKIAISPDHSISNVFLVDSLDYNLISVSQLCKIGYNCLFTDICVTVFRRSDDSIAFKGVSDGQLYLVEFNDNNAELNTCLIAKTNMGWLWHRRLAHVGMKNLHKLLK
jgi:hypothetical protein